MPRQYFVNNFSTTLIADCSAVATSIWIGSTQAQILYDVMPGTGDFVVLTLHSTSTGNTEVVKVDRLALIESAGTTTGEINTTLGVSSRAFEAIDGVGAAAKAFVTGDKVGLRITASLMDAIAARQTTAFIDTLLDDADAAAARATLEISSISALGAGALVYKTSNQIMTSGAAVTWDAATYDDASAYAGGSPTRLTVPAGITRVRFSAGLLGSGAANALYSLHKNGLEVYAGGMGLQPNTNVVATHKSAILVVIAGDYFEIVCDDISTGTTVIGSIAHASWFAMEFVR